MIAFGTAFGSAIAAWHLADSRPLLVAFTASWCHHCRTMQTEWQKLERLCAGTPIRVRQVDCGDTCDVHRFPTVRLYSACTYQDYTGPRTAQSMFDWASHRIRR